MSIQQESIKYGYKLLLIIKVINKYMYFAYFLLIKFDICLYDEYNALSIRLNN